MAKTAGAETRSDGSIVTRFLARYALLSDGKIPYDDGMFISFSGVPWEEECWEIIYFIHV